MTTKVVGINQWDEEWEVGSISGSGTNQSANDRIRSKNYIPVIPNATYYYYINSTYGIYTWGYDANKNYVGRVPSNGYAVSNNTVTIPNDVHYIRFVVQPNYGTTYNNDISINYPSTDHDYHAYNGQTITSTLPQLVYGGTLDLVSGKLTVTDANIASYNGETLPSTWISDRDVYASGTTPTTGAQVVYKLATPTVIDLTPQQINTLLGENNIWADCGDVLEVAFEYDGMLSALPSQATAVVGRCIGDVNFNGVSTMPFTLVVQKDNKGV